MIVIPPCQFYKVNRNADFCFMKNFLSWMVLLMVLSNAYGQHPYCSKYKLVTKANRLIIEDLRSDSLDIVHVKLIMDMTDVVNQQISASAELSVVSKTDGLESIDIDLEGLTVDSVAGPNVTSFEQMSASVRVQLDPLSMDEASTIRIHYSGSPMQDASGWGGFYFSGNFSWNLGVGFEDDPHSYGRIWHPCFDNFIEKATYEFEVTTMDDRVAACNGLLLETTDNGNGTVTYYWRLDQPISSYLANVSVAPYISVEGSIDAINGSLPYQIFGRKSDSSNIIGSFQNLEAAVKRFEETYGEYRFDKVGYNLVPFNAGAMEHATNITYPIYAVNGGLGQEELMAHELAHMWWGDNVTCQTDGDMWINEGWASFSEYLFLEDVYSRERYESAMKADLREMLQFAHHREEMYRAVSGQPHEYVYGDHVYKKGALVAHNLRGYMGDEAFFSAIDQFMEQFKHSAVSSDSLEKWFSIYSGQDLSSFFRDWVFTPGYSVVILDSFYYTGSEGNFDVDLYLKQKLKGRSEFHDDVPVYYTVYDADWNKESGKLEMSGEYENQMISTSIEPHYIELYNRNELAQARTVDREIISEEGSLNLDNMHWHVTVESVSDSALVWFEHIWSAPDLQKNWDKKPYRLSNYHYWKVSGIDIEKLEMSGRFFYDGREGGGTGYMDMDLVSEQEDSLVLLYRVNTHEDWSEYEFYTKNLLGASDNGFGLMELERILEGEYALANIDHTILGQTGEEMGSVIRVYPNPTNHQITFEVPGVNSNEPMNLTLMDSKGVEVLKERITESKHIQDVRHLAKGIYHYSIMNSNDTLTGSFLIE